MSRRGHRPGALAGEAPLATRVGAAGGPPIVGRRLVASTLIALALGAAACGATSARDPDDPFGDPFFDDGFGGSSLDEILNQRAPSVGWLAAPRDDEDAAEEEEEEAPRPRGSAASRGRPAPAPGDWTSGPPGEKPAATAGDWTSGPTSGRPAPALREKTAATAGDEQELLKRERTAAGAGDLVAAEERLARGGGDDDAPAAGGEDEEGAPLSRVRKKSFSDKAGEAALATMSVLIGAGMAALPYLIGGF